MLMEWRRSVFASGRWMSAGKGGGEGGQGDVYFDFKVILSRDASLVLKLHLIVLTWLLACLVLTVHRKVIVDGTCV